MLVELQEFILNQSLLVQLCLMYIFVYTVLYVVFYGVYKLCMKVIASNRSSMR